MSGLRTPSHDGILAKRVLLFSSERFSKSRYTEENWMYPELVIPRAYKPHTSAIPTDARKICKTPSLDIAMKKRHSRAIEPTVLTSRVFLYISYHL